MTTWFVSRHPGAIEWARRQKLAIDNWVPHLDPSEVMPGDTVIGTLPVSLIAGICAKGARFMFLELNLTEQQRGRELSAAEMQEVSCSLREYFVRPGSQPDL